MGVGDGMNDSGTPEVGKPTLRSLLRSLFLSRGIVIPQQVIVPDISFWQDSADFVKMKANGARGVIIRAGQNLWPDPKFPMFWQGAKAAGLPRGAYFYYDSRVHPTLQADLFYGQIKNDMPEMEVVADYEEGYGGPYGGWENLKLFLERLKSNGVPAEKIAIYTGYYYWRSNSPQSDGTALNYFRQYRLWLAWYTTNPANVSIPAPWSNDDLVFWQYTSSGDGKAYGVGSNEIDLNYFNGTAAEFDQRYRTIPIPPPEERPDEFIFLYAGAVTQVEMLRFGADCHALICDPSRVHFVVTDHFNTLSNAMSEYVAFVGVNGDGWGSRTSEGIPAWLPNSIAVSNGRWIQSSQYDGRPWIAFYADGSIKIDHRNIGNPENVVSGDRYLVIDGAPNPALASKYHEKNARTAVGLRADGKVILFTCDGWDRNIVTGEAPKGLNWNELAAVLVELEARTAINLDGGGSTTMAVVK